MSCMFEHEIDQLENNGWLSWLYFVSTDQHTFYSSRDDALAVARVSRRRSYTVYKIAFDDAIGPAARLELAYTNNATNAGGSVVMCVTTQDWDRRSGVPVFSSQNGHDVALTEEQAVELFGQATCPNCQDDLCDRSYDPNLGCFDPRSPRGSGCAEAYLCSSHSHVVLDSDDAQCENCESCMAHCECYTCDGCNERVSSLYCSDCESCEECGCTCESNDDDDSNSSGIYLSIPTSVRFPTMHFAKPRVQTRVNPLTRVVACEIEVAGSNSYYGDDISRVVRELWTGNIVTDGSLGPGGYEINTAPAGGDLFVKQITEICAVLNKADARVDSKCGLHVHVDARDFAWTDMRRLCLVYEAVEPALFRLVPDSRRNNTYCRSCGPRFGDMARGGFGTRAFKSVVRAKMYGLAGSRSKVPDDKYNSNRYDAMNIHSWFVRGSVEFRLGAGSVNGTKIINWALLCANIVEWSARSSDAAVASLPSSGTPSLPTYSLAQSFSILHHVVPKSLHSWIAERYNRFNTDPMPPISDIKLTRPATFVAPEVA